MSEKTYQIIVPGAPSITIKASGIRASNDGVIITLLDDKLQPKHIIVAANVRAVIEQE